MAILESKLSAQDVDFINGIMSQYEMNLSFHNQMMKESLKKINSVDISKQNAKNAKILSIQKTAFKKQLEGSEKTLNITKERISLLKAKLILQKMDGAVDKLFADSGSMELGSDSGIALISDCEVIDLDIENLLNEGGHAEHNEDESDEDKHTEYGDGI